MYLKYLKVEKRYSSHTIKGYEDDLLELYDFKVDVLKYGGKDVREYLEYLYARGLSRNSISRKLSSIRSFYHYLVKEGLMGDSPFADISNPKKSGSLPKYVRDSDLEKMFHCFSLEDVYGIRNTCILEMLYATGSRVSELVSIKICDISFDEKRILIRGKGSKERIVFYGSYCEDILRLYLKKSYFVLNGGKSALKNDYLFLNKNGGKLSERYVRKVIDMAVQKCGVDYHISPHTLRHTFATDLLNNGADLMTVKELLGHSSVNTTGIYTHVSNERLKEVYGKTHPRGKE